MADQVSNQKVEYSYTGDVSSLKKATQDAISLLTNYQKKMQQMSDDNAFTRNQRTVTSLNKTLQALGNAVDSVKDKTNAMSDAKWSDAARAAESLKEAVNRLNEAYRSLSSSSKVTEKDARSMRDTMKEASRSFQDAGTKVDTATVNNEKAESRINSFKDKVMSAASSMSAKWAELGNKFATTKLGEKLSTASTYVTKFGSAIKEVTAAFRRDGPGEDASDFTKDLASKLSPFLGTIHKIEDATKTATAAFNVLKKAVMSVVSFGVTNLKKIVDVFENIYSAIHGAVTGVIDFADKFNLIGNAVTSVNGFLQDLAGVGLGISLGNAMKEAIGFSENLNLFQVALGNSRKAGEKFVDTMQEIYGMDPSQVMSSVGYFYQLADAVDTGSKEAYNMSTNLTKMSADIASLFNMDVATVQENLASGMQGMSRAVRKYGMDIRATTLQETAATLGITQKVSAMSEADRQGLRYITMMRQAAKANNDFSNTIESPANQLKIFKEQIVQLGRSIGAFFIPMLQAVLPVLNGIIMAIRVILTFIATLMGIKLKNYNTSISAAAGGATSALGNESKAIDGVGDSAKKTAKKVKDLIAPFDELNILQEESDSNAGGTSGSSGGAGGGGGTDIGAMNPAIAAAVDALGAKFDNVKMKANQVRDAILKLFGLKVDDGHITAVVGGLIYNLEQAWKAADYTKFGSIIAEFFNKGIDWALQNVNWTKIGPTVTKYINAAVDMINGFLTTFNWNGLGHVVANGINIVLHSIQTAIQRFNWAALGKAVANFCIGLFSNIDWKLAINTVYLGLSGVITSIKTFFATIDWSNVVTSIASSINLIAKRTRDLIGQIDWKQFGESVATNVNKFLSEVDWTSVGETIHAAINALLQLAIGFLEKLDYKKVADAITDTLSGLDWPNLFASVVRIMVDAWWLKFQLKWSVGLSIIKDAGLALIEGLKSGITSGLRNIGNWIKSNIIDPIVNFVKELFGIHSPSTVFADIGNNLIQGLYNGITNILADVGTWIKLHITDPFLGWIDRHFGISKGSSTKMSDTGSALIAGLKNGLSTKWSEITTFLSTKWSDVKTWFAKNVEPKFTAAKWSKRFNCIKEGMKDAINGTIGIVESGVNWIINKLNTIHFEIPNWVPLVGGKSWGFNMNPISIPRLATGGVVTGPTQAVIGEGRYPEAVVPLGNSPQAEDLIRRIADAVGGNPTFEVKVYIGQDEFDAYTYQAVKRGEKKVGAQPIQK